MLLKMSLIAAVFICSVAGATDSRVPGLSHKSYKLKSFSKHFRGKKTETRAGRDRFCGEKISPTLREADGKLSLELNAGIGFEWRDINDNPAEMSDGCRYPVEQKISSTRDSTSLILVNAEDCGSGKSVVGSQRDTLLLNGAEITYSSESVLKDASHSWRVNEAKESFTCIWTAAD